VQIDRVVDARLLRAIVTGVTSGGGEILRATQVQLLRSGEKNCWLEIVLDEGKNRQIRRMLAAFEVEVLKLVRVSIGPLQLGKLAKGAYRPLTREEKLAVDRATAEIGRQRKTSGL